MNKQKTTFKEIFTVITFLTVIFSLTFANFMSKDNDISFSERRKLSKFPSYSFEKLFKGTFIEEFEKYTLDQFVFRDNLRSLKAYCKYYILNQKDNNNIYISNGHISKLEYPLNENSIKNAIEKFNFISKEYFSGKNIYYGIIPDKNYFLARENGYLHIDYSKFEKIFNKNLNNMIYINLFDSLSIDDYYKTDIHWSQNKLKDISFKILKAMNSDINFDNRDFKENVLSPFYGSYYGQSAIKSQPDSIVFLTNTLIDNAFVYNHLSNSFGYIYDLNEFNSIDPYNLFLSGVQALLTITNDVSTSEKELIMFRDSFGSSITPLLLDGYSKITLVDLRYISYELLENYIDLSSYDDVLFLYSTPILNNSYMLK